MVKVFTFEEKFEFTRSVGEITKSVDLFIDFNETSHDREVYVFVVYIPVN